MLSRLVRLRYVVLGGALLLTAGRLLDLWWHARYEEFERDGGKGIHRDGAGHHP